MVFIATASADQNKVQNSQLIGRIEGGGVYGGWEVIVWGVKAVTSFLSKEKNIFYYFRCSVEEGGLLLLYRLAYYYCKCSDNCVV